MNKFLSATTQWDTFTENGALSNSSTGDTFLNYFSNAGSYRGRVQEDVDADVSRMWGEDPLQTMRMLFYLRLITRKSKGFFETEEVQSGQGNRDEFRKGMNWIARYYSAHFNDNMWLIPIAGVWKDLWHQDLIDVVDHNKVYALIVEGLKDPYNRDLLAKYLPRIRSASNTKNERHKSLNSFARGLCTYLSWTEKDYRKFKSSGNAHQFQKCMSNNLWNQIDFNRISGKALLQLVTHKGKDGKTTIERHNQEDRYLNWIKTQPVAKFNGHVHELTKVARENTLSPTKKFTLDKQFEGLLETARKNTGGIHGNVWCALDTSGSMTWSLNSHLIGASPYDICIGLGIFFSSLNTGAFKDNVIMFDDTSRKQLLSGTFTDKLSQIRPGAMGGTNFQSVIDEIVRIRQQNPNIPIEDYPETLLVVSDMQFNCTGSTQTNYQTAMSKLNSVGLPNIRIIWWDVTGRKNDFPSTLEDEGTILISGFDGSIITLLLGGNQQVVDPVTGKNRALTPIEQMDKALSQELLLQVK